MGVKLISLDMEKDPDTNIIKRVYTFKFTNGDVTSKYKVVFQSEDWEVLKEKVQQEYNIFMRVSTEIVNRVKWISYKKD